MAHQFHDKLEKKLERYKKLQEKISGSIERVVNNEILEKNRDNIVQTLEGLNSIRTNFQNEFRNITIELHKDLLAHFENFQLDSGFNQLHERYLKFIEKLNEKHLAMTSECDEIVAKIEEIYKKKMEELKVTEKQLAETKQQILQQDDLSDKKSPAKADHDQDSPASANPILGREHSSHQHQRKSSQANQADGTSGIFGKVKSLLKAKNKEKEEGVVRTEMKLGGSANFKWDPVKKKYIFEGEEEQPEEDIPLPPKKLEEKPKKDDAPAKESEKSDKAQLGMSDMLKPHTSNLGFMRKKQAPGGNKQPGGAMKPLNMFVPAVIQNQDVYNSEPTSSILQEKKQPLCIKMFTELESLLSGLAIKNISSASYLQPLNEIIALAKEDAAHLEEHQTELEAVRLETEKAHQTIKTYQIFNNVKDEAIKKLMESERQATEKLLSLEMEKEALKSSLELYKDLLHSKSVSTADEDEEPEQKPQYQSMVQERHFESLLKELSMQEKVIQLSDEINSLKLQECELESKAKLAEERAEIYHKRLEEREKEFKDLQTLFDDKHEKDEASLRLMQRAYELGKKVENRGKKIQELNKLCKQISEEMGEKNKYISELKGKLKRAEGRVHEKEGIIQEQLETIHSLEDSLAAAEKDRSEAVSLQEEKDELQKSLDSTRKELSTTRDSLNKLFADASAQNKRFEELRQELEAEKKEKENLSKELEAQKTRVLSSSVLESFENNLNEFSDILQFSEGHITLGGLSSEVAFEKIFETMSSFKNKVRGLVDEHNVEKSSLIEEIEALRLGIDQEKDNHKQTQSLLNEELNDLKKELEYVTNQAREASQTKDNYEALSAKLDDAAKENMTLESKNQALLESFAENLKQQMRLALKHRLIKDAYAKLQGAHTKAAEAWQSSQNESQTAFDELKRAYDELRDSYDEHQSAYEELRKSYIELRDSYEGEHAVNQKLQDAYNEAHSTYDSLRQTYDELGHAYEQLKTSYDSLKAEYNNLKQYCDQLESDYQTVSKKYEDSKAVEENEKGSLGVLYHTLQKEHEGLTVSHENLKNTNKELQELIEQLKEEKNEIESRLQSEIELLTGKINELQTNFDNLTEEQYKANQNEKSETNKQLHDERERAASLSQQLSQALADLEAANADNAGFKDSYENQIMSLQAEFERLQLENEQLHSDLQQKTTEFQENQANINSFKHEHEAGWRFEQENREKLQDSLNKLQIEYDQLKLKHSEALNQRQETGLSDPVLETVIRCYKEVVSEEVPEDQGVMILNLLEQMRKTRGTHESSYNKDDELSKLTTRLEEIQNENHRLLDTIALLEGDKGENQEVDNLKSLLEKKSKRVDELNSIIEEKNKELQKLRQNPISPNQIKQSEASEDGDREGLIKEAERLNAENSELRKKNEAKSKQIEEQTENLSHLEQKLKLMQREIDILMLDHNEELERLNKEMKKERALLQKEYVDPKFLEPTVKIIGEKIASDSKTATQQATLPEDPVIIGKKGTGSPDANKTGDSSKKPESTPKKDEELRKSQGGGFLSSVASFFLTENEKKKLIQE